MAGVTRFSLVMYVHIYRQMLSPERIGAFVEYVAQPLTEDIRLILEQLRSLNIGLTQETIKSTCFALGLWHLAGELIRAASYIIITWILCQTVHSLWSWPSATNLIR